MHDYIFQVFEDQKSILIFNKDIENFEDVDINKYEEYFNIYEEEDKINPFKYNTGVDISFNDVVSLIRNDSSFKEQIIPKEFIDKFNEVHKQSIDDWSDNSSHVLITHDVDCYYEIFDDPNCISGFYVVPKNIFNGFMSDSGTIILIDGFDYSECMKSTFEFKDNQTVEELREHLNSFGWEEKILFKEEDELQPVLGLGCIPNPESPEPDCDDDCDCSGGIMVISNPGKANQKTKVVKDLKITINSDGSTTEESTPIEEPEEDLTLVDSRFHNKLYDRDLEKSAKCCLEYLESINSENFKEHKAVIEIVINLINNKNFLNSLDDFYGRKIANKFLDLRDEFDLSLEPSGNIDFDFVSKFFTGDNVKYVPYIRMLFKKCINTELTTVFENISNFVDFIFACKGNTDVIFSDVIPSELTDNIAYSIRKITDKIYTVGNLMVSTSIVIIVSSEELNNIPHYWRLSSILLRENVRKILEEQVEFNRSIFN
jgi:hypothetical protein